MVKHMRLKHMISGTHKAQDLKTNAPDNAEEAAQEPGESLSSKSDVVNDECNLNVNDVDQPDSTDPTE